VKPLRPTLKQDNRGGLREVPYGRDFLAILMFGLLIAAMAIGVLMGGKPISGSCGGVGALWAKLTTTAISVVAIPINVMSKSGSELGL